jgi:hypothetical protein
LSRLWPEALRGGNEPCMMPPYLIFTTTGLLLKKTRFSYTRFKIHGISPTDGIGFESCSAGVPAVSPTDGIGFESCSAGVPAERGSSVSYLNF